MPTQLRGPLKYYSDGGTRNPDGTSSPAAEPYLNGAPLEWVDVLPRVSAALPDEGPRSFGYAWSAMEYPGPYTAATLGGHTATLPNSGTITDRGVLGGVIRSTTGAASGNQNKIITATNMQVVAGKHIWFSIRLAAVAVANQALLFGLFDSVPADITGALGSTNGIFFIKSAAGTGLDFHVRKAGTSTTVTGVDTKVSGGVALADGVFTEYGFLVDTGGTVNPGAGAISCYVNSKFAGSVASTDANIPSVVIGLVIVNQTAAVATASLDISQCLCMEEL